MQQIAPERLEQIRNAYRADVGEGNWVPWPGTLLGCTIIIRELLDEIDRLNFIVTEQQGDIGTVHNLIKQT